MTEAQGAEGTQPQLQWKTPPGWQEQTPSGMSIASFLISGEQGRNAQLSVMTFPGEGAAELSLINIVRENAGLPPITEEELARLVEAVKNGSESAEMIDLTGSLNAYSSRNSNRILTADLPH